MPRNFVTVNGTVNIDGNPREKKVSIFSAGGNAVPTIVGHATSSDIDGSYSVDVLKERDGYLMGIAYDDYGKTWSPSTAFALDDLAIPLTANTHWYKVTTAGTTGASEPTWPTGGGTVADGTVVWTDMGLIESPVARGPFQTSDPVADATVVHMVRCQDYLGYDEVSGTYGTSFKPPVIDTAVKKWGNSSIKFDGVDDYLSYPAITFSGDYTIDVWVRFTSLPTDFNRPFIYIGDLGSNANRIQVGLRTDNKVDFYFEANSGATSSYPITPGTFAIDTWYLISAEKYNGAFYIYVNGSMVNSVAGTVSVTPAGTATTWLGVGRASSGNRYCPCLIGESRISNVAKYGGTSFTAPTTPYTL